MTSADPATVTKVLPPRSPLTAATALILSATISTLLLGGVVGLFEKRSGPASQSPASAATAPASAASEAIASRSPHNMKG